ncbi:hypothetical protein H4N54_26095 [Limnospira fusiformis KN01]|uniref:hypothetical protein n=1 Tax=Limnospira TaxID=2596745 RepID=UPI00024813EE|nr:MULTISPECIES: hypothetical protein [Limnospira]MDC0839221.1 hypothetical protein [Limnoraphis robusta]MDT9217633.1 hypothetical protein [Limnospira sp. PMC 1240.20]MDY7051810.1 hypothetical protein [Limnospira fusiformis LS22]ULB45812.1 hypothetical protein H4N54_26095 [Limnospira fusiformis KN01]
MRQLKWTATIFHTLQITGETGKIPQQSLSHQVICCGGVEIGKLSQREEHGKH